MKFSLSSTPILLLSALFIMSACSKTENENILEVRKTSWNLWMKDFIATPAGAGIVADGTEGLYRKQLVAPAGDAKAIEQGKWIMVNYTGSTIQGNVFGTRNEEVAKQQGTYTIYTHYVPRLIYFPETANYWALSTGEYEILNSMKEGERVMAYIPSYLGYGSSGMSYSNGYQGQYSLGANTNIKVDMELVKVIDDIEKYEKTNVENYAFDPNKWDFDGTKWQLSFADSVKTNLFVKRDIYTKLVPTEKRDSITADSTVKIYYVASFLDGFILDTNIDSVAQRVWNNYTKHSATTYTPSTGTLIQAFKDVVPTMVYNQWAQMVFTSTYGYGSSGSTSGNTVIQPYDPLVYRIYIKSNKDDESDDK